ncbi:uncharacterized protein LOC132759795 [Ruditapes philippinarum]|uniref:uncharacterized protein LOC132759795 n=1 Tax=Ruditapes philippinarum TaxID=129788 RepID=UPI00295BDA04|nr:uncharacterized protein LOC132759795 [Ruditapes philippinarum]
MTMLKQKFEKDRQRYRDNIRGFQPIELCLMKRNNAEQKVKQHLDDLQMEIDIENNVIAFEGSVESVKEAQIKLYEMKSNFGKRQVKVSSNMCIALYKSKDVVHFIQNILEENGLQAVWEINESSLLICCMQEEMLDECTEIILEGIKEEVIEYDADSVPYMRTDTWAKKKDSLLTHYNGKIGICIAEDETQVIVCVTKDIHKAVIAEVKQFLDSSTIMSENLYYSKEVIRLIEKHHRQEITDIENGQKAYSVQIKTLEHYSGIYVCGLSPGLQETVLKVTKLNGKVKKTDSF